MALRCNLNPSQNPSLWPLVLLWTLIGFTSCSESANQISFSGVIGGNVTFPCPVDKIKPVTLFYVQRKDMFVNGYYVSKTMTVKSWENTWVNRSESTVHMYGLNISHIGEYQCYVQYSGDVKLVATSVNLRVTAVYSKPTFTTTCKKENHSVLCAVTCASHGGYPRADMRFEVNEKGNSSRPMWNVVDNLATADADTMLFNSSSTVHFNCSDGEVNLIRCSVGEASSDLFSVCKPAPPPPDNLGPVIVVIAIGLLVIVMIAVVWWRQHCKHNKTQPRVAECRTHGPAGEVLLKDTMVTEVP